MKPLPKQITARWHDDDGEPFLHAYEKIAEHAEFGEQRAVGVYQLVRVEYVEAMASVTPMADPKANRSRRAAKPSTGRHPFKGKR